MFIAQHEHGAGQHRCSVTDHFIRTAADRLRCAVIRIDAHASRAEDQIAPCRQHLFDRVCSHRGIIIDDAVLRHRAAVFRKFLLDHRRKFIFDQTVKYFAAGRHDAGAFGLKRQDPQDRSSCRRCCRALHLIAGYGQRNHPGPGDFVPFSDRKISVSCSDHHLSDAVDRAETSSVDLEQTVYTRRQFYFSLGDLRWYKKCRIIHPAGDDIARVIIFRRAGGHTNTAAQLV